MDRYRRTSLIDHFLPSGLDLASFAEMRYDELGNFVEQLYEANVSQAESGLAVTLSRSGMV